jgi:hypothetical protein
MLLQAIKRQKTLNGKISTEALAGCNAALRVIHYMRDDNHDS